MDTKEEILHTALRLFAKNGYEATSVSDIAGELGMTKGALYKHYKNKRDLFESIVERVYRMDVERAGQYEVPQETFDRSPAAYRAAGMDKVKAFIEAQFQFWILDEFGRNFRKLLTLEQYRNQELMELYQTCLVSGPVSYMEDLFRESMKQGAWNEGDPKQLALEFYAPFYLLVSMSDASSDATVEAKRLSAHIEAFVEKNLAERNEWD